MIQTARRISGDRSDLRGKPPCKAATLNEEIIELNYCLRLHISGQFECIATASNINP